MIPLAIPDLSGNESRYLQECVTTNFVSSVGPFVSRFEEQVAKASGNLRGVATASGTAGLHAALLAVGVGRDDLVILPTLTFIASANAISYCGADPWLFDVEAKSWNLDCELLEHELATGSKVRNGVLLHRATGRRIAAIMPVYTLGLPANMSAIVAIAKKYDLPIVADAAAALGASQKNRPVGALGADLTVFSFNGNKTLTCGGGGAVVGDDPQLLDQVRHLTTTARCGSGYDHDRIGFNYRMTNLQAAVGCAQLERIDQLVGAKQQIRKNYDQAFANIPGLTPFPGLFADMPDYPAESQSSCWFSGVLVEDSASEWIDKLRETLLAVGIEARPFWKPIHLQKPYQSSPKTAVAVSEDIWFRIIVLPCSVGLSVEEQEKTINGLVQAVSN